MGKFVSDTTQERRTLLSLIWIFLSVNYILCDVLSNMEASVLQQMMKGQIAGMELTQGFLLFAAITLEIPFIMIVLSRMLPFRVNKILNIIAGSMMIIYQLSSYHMGTLPSLHYIFFSVVEILGNVIILVLALKWTDGKN
ncbi:MAG TPA: DUF6326 family protein [Patescibacteria group bacterium]|nr:DUF6326 family protein [Patescibacteria group bacterium]